VLARFFLLIILFIVIARNFWRFVDGVVSGATGSSAQGGKRASKTPVAVKMSQCPVCGTYVVPGKAISVMSGGTPLYFDSEKCRAEYQSR
jgi:hypothetical protein